MTIEGIPDGWELVRIGSVCYGEWRLMKSGSVMQWDVMEPSLGWAVVLRKIEKPKRFRPFANAAEYFANRREGFAVDGKDNTIAPGFFTVVSANQPYCWVAFGTKIVRFDWAEAFEKLQFRHHDNSTSPFGIEVTE